MKKVGIITMHRVLNCGSILQAYALQRVIKEMGYDCEIIDYIYPNGYHKKFLQKGSLLKSIGRLLYSPIIKLREKRFKSFFNRHIKLSNAQYTTFDEISSNPPKYDIYVTGSDQVWNPNTTFKDTTFLLSFICNVPKISYSASFAIDAIPVQLKEEYSKWLKQYSSISVREQSGCKIINELTGKGAKVVLDPTLLLSSEQYDEIAEESLIKPNEPFILAYLMQYSFCPFPYAKGLLEHIQRSTGIKRIYFVGADSRIITGHGIVKLLKVGPAEFVYLFKNASFVLTTSFHGTAFSIIYKRPFLSLIRRNNKDSRLLNLMELTGLTNHAVYMDDKFPKIDINSKVEADGLEELRKDSIKFLKEALENE